jgi:hypothetical protein
MPLGPQGPSITLFWAQSPRVVGWFRGFGGSGPDCQTMIFERPRHYIFFRPPPSSAYSDAGAMIDDTMDDTVPTVVVCSCCSAVGGQATALFCALFALFCALFVLCLDCCMHGRGFQLSRGDSNFQEDPAFLLDVLPIQLQILELQLPMLQLPMHGLPCRF